MRGRWQTVSRLWEENKAAANKLDLLGQLDYYGNLSAQLRMASGSWRQAGSESCTTDSGAPTAALLHDNDALADYKLFWITCKNARKPTTCWP